jgi:hypothetical protein
MDRVAIWFERSGVVPLEISVALSKTCLTIDISPLYSALVAVSRRWKSLEIPLSDDGSPVLSLTSENVPLLEVVKISQRDPPLEPPDCTSLLFLATRSLRSLTIPGSPNFQETSVSWKSLTYLNITPSRNRRLTTAVALAILRQSTNLQTCHFVITDVEGEGFVPGEHFSLPQLSHFSVRRNGVLPRDHSLGSITLPNLQSLDYFSNSGYADSNLAQLLPSTPSLEWFKIQIGGLRSDTLLDALSHMPTLKRLTILDEPANTDDWFLPRDERFLEHLTLSQGPEPDRVVCPCLEAIELYNFNALSDVTLLQFVRLRTEPQHQDVACLSRVFVQFTRCIEFDIQLHLQDAIAGGLVMDLNYVKPRFTYSPFEGTNDWNPWR